jgi:hypothetical protein
LNPWNSEAWFSGLTASLAILPEYVCVGILLLLISSLKFVLEFNYKTRLDDVEAGSEINFSNKIHLGKNGKKVKSVGRQK